LVAVRLSFVDEQPKYCEEIKDIEFRVSKFEMRFLIKADVYRGSDRAQPLPRGHFAGLSLLASALKPFKRAA
jgi:hypothetical protein